MISMRRTLTNLANGRKRHFFEVVKVDRFLKLRTFPVVVFLHGAGDGKFSVSILRKFG